MKSSPQRNVHWVRRATHAGHKGGHTPNNAPLYETGGCCSLAYLIIVYKKVPIEEVERANCH